MIPEFFKFCNSGTNLASGSKSIQSEVTHCLSTHCYISYADILIGPIQLLVVLGILTHKFVSVAIEY